MEKNSTKRKFRGYKIKDTDYYRAMKWADRKKESLATVLEQVVIAYGNGETSFRFSDTKLTDYKAIQQDPTPMNDGINASDGEWPWMR